MPTIIKRGKAQYQAIVRQVGFPTETKTFETRREAKTWAAETERDMRRGTYVDLSEAESTPLLKILERYSLEVTPTKRGRGPELSRLKRLMAHSIAGRHLTKLRSLDFSLYRDERLKEGAADKTVREELLLLSTVLNTARREWSIPVENWIEHVRKPAPGRHRERRPTAEEEAKLMAACRESKSGCLEAAVILAVETGMRRGEIAALVWSQIDLGAHVVRLSVTKNGDRRVVPLSVAAEDALRKLPRHINGKVFSFHDSNGLGAAYARACVRAGIEDLRFHDLRHEAASRFAPSMPATVLAKLMGWRSIQMSMRYYNPNESELVALVRAA